MNSVKRNLQIHNIILNYYLLSIEPKKPSIHNDLNLKNISF